MRYNFFVELMFIKKGEKNGKKNGSLQMRIVRQYC
jgi:hypothetical protein